MGILVAFAMFIARSRESESMHGRMIPVILVVSTLVSGSCPVRDLIVMPSDRFEVLSDFVVCIILLCIVERRVFPVSRVESWLQKIDTRVSNMGIRRMEFFDRGKRFTGRREGESEYEVNIYILHSCMLE